VVAVDNKGLTRRGGSGAGWGQRVERNWRSSKSVWASNLSGVMGCDSGEEEEICESLREKVHQNI
jgi:hypothetical protein